MSNFVHVRDMIFRLAPDPESSIPLLVGYSIIFLPSSVERDSFLATVHSHNANDFHQQFHINIGKGDRVACRRSCIGPWRVDPGMMGKWRGSILGSSLVHVPCFLNNEMLWDSASKTSPSNDRKGPWPPGLKYWCTCVVKLRASWVRCSSKSWPNPSAMLG